MVAAGKRILTVTPLTAHGAAGQPHERARAARVRRLALDRAEDLGNSEHFPDFRFSIRECRFARGKLQRPVFIKLAGKRIGRKRLKIVIA